MDKQESISTYPAGPLRLLHLMQAYNRGELNYEQWVQQTREWAEAILRYHQQPPDTARVSD
jgi:hypothetical protein